MRRIQLLALAGLLALFAAFFAWRIVITTTAAHLASDQPHRALAWSPTEPEAVLALAQEQLDAQQLQDATLTAHRLLRNSPLQAQALVLLARVADARHDPQVAELFQIAVQRSPRDQYARAWLIGEQLRAGRHDEALMHVNKLLGYAPWLRGALLPVLAKATADQGFAAAMVAVLNESPSWRSAFLNTLLKEADQVAIDSVYGGLLDANALSDAEARQWFEWLAKAGSWGQAYSYWVSWLRLPKGTSLSLVHDGGFDAVASGVGFDWHMQGGSGVLIERVLDGGNPVVQVAFLGRRTERIGLHQTLLLAPGRYRLQFRAKGRDLRSDRGIRWALRCNGGNPMQANADVLQGSFDWKPVQMAFEVPLDSCPSQVLALENPGARGAGKIVSGTLWFDDFAVVSEGGGSRQGSSGLISTGPSP
ncbi:hypothetical protein [Denitratimonas sp. CY0512]|uniref:tetratricopeptide repeat protein n=1 Tax=Denitratimonas sp. CY0512 TaxID=3131940 RepID=UPI0030B2E234